MLSCADGSYYVGTATGSDLKRRVSEHQSGVRPRYYSQLVWSEYFDRVTYAIAVERKLKGWSRAKKHALIVDDVT
ncbi:MAG: GIY-YIG nuclease family protein [Pseudolabrys sp.]